MEGNARTRAGRFRLGKGSLSLADMPSELLRAHEFASRTSKTSTGHQANSVNETSLSFVWIAAHDCFRLCGANHYHCRQSRSRSDSQLARWLWLVRSAKER